MQIRTVRTSDGRLFGGDTSSFPPPTIHNTNPNELTQCNNFSDGGFFNISALNEDILASLYAHGNSSESVLSDEYCEGSNPNNTSPNIKGCKLQPMIITLPMPTLLTIPLLLLTYLTLQFQPLPPLPHKWNWCHGF